MREDSSRKIGFFSIGLLATALLAVVDWFTGADIAFFSFYLFPILLVSWKSGPGWSAAIGAIAIGISLMANNFMPPGDAPADDIASIGFDSLEKVIVVTILIVIAERVRALIVRERKLARSDYLTGLGNRRKFMEELRERLEKGEQCSILYISIDNLFDVSARIDQRSSETLVKLIAEFLRKRYPGCCRFEEDRFVAFLSHSDARDALASAGLLRDELWNLVYKARKIDMRVSMGAIAIKKRGLSAGVVLRSMYAAMDGIKAEGGDGLELVEI